MTFDINLGVIIATLFGPVFAVQVQKFLETRREEQARKLRLFSTLMSTRANRLSITHVEALNLIDLVFYKETKIITAWKEYLDGLIMPPNLTEAQQQAIFSRREDLFVSLLFTMSQNLNFSFDRVQLKKAIYSPVAHEEQTLKQNALLDAVLNLTTGQLPLTMKVLQMPAGDPAIIKQYQLNMERIANALEGIQAGSIKLTNDQSGLDLI